MSRKALLQECDQATSELLGDQPRPLQKALAALLVGVVLKGSITLTRASAAIPGAAQTGSKMRRSQRLLANERLEVGRAQRRLISRVLSSCHGRVHLLLDATTTGVTKTQPGTMTLILALAWHHRALPLWWKSWPTYERGQNWREALATMIAEVNTLLPADAEVILLADRQFPGRPILGRLEAAGWHYLMRVRRTFHVRQDATAVVALGDLVPTTGSRQLLTEVEVCGRETNVVAVWPKHSKDPWLLVTDLPATLRRCQEYRMRTWEEELFRDLKSAGWGWDASRVRKPERVERLLLVLALATLWVLALAQRLIKRGHRYWVEERSRRHASYFRLGLQAIDRLLANDQPIPCLLSLWTEHHAT